MTTRKFAIKYMTAMWGLDAQAPLRCTNCNTPSINSQYSNFILDTAL